MIVVAMRDDQALDEIDAEFGQELKRRFVALRTTVDDDSLPTAEKNYLRRSLPDVHEIDFHDRSSGGN